MEPISHIQDLMGAGRLESAWDIAKKNHISPEDLEYKKAFKDLERDLDRETVKGDIRAENRLKRRIYALKAFQKFGFVPQKLMPQVALPQGYLGKVLLICIVGGETHDLVCLRSGDDWHREILQNAREEIQDLGFDKSQVTPMGGAWVRFDPEDTIQIYGISDEFGGCDKNIAAELIKHTFPDLKIYIRP
jgi:Janus/Ocnus family (Ocnus)